MVVGVGTGVASGLIFDMAPERGSFHLRASVAARIAAAGSSPEWLLAE
jgi:uncharacterized membrane protein YeiH